MTSTPSTLRVDQLGQKLGWAFAATVEQARIIEFDRAEPALVLAGAGSGKTHTMAQRVIWLVANGLANPAQILGLTFTRKATHELNTRVNRGLRELRHAGLLAADDLLDAPTIVTYNSFANSIFRDNALRVGREPDSTLLTEAGAWQLAYRIVCESGDRRLGDLDLSPARITEAVLDLAHALVEHGVDDATPHLLARDFAALSELPVPPGRRGAHPRIGAAVRNVAALDVLMPLCAEFERQKAGRGLVEYSDQVAFAVQAVAANPSLVTDYRDRYRYILLDEYQDTSVSQTALLAELFSDTPVMAVGDPHQSIYGWRGASAGNLERFPRDFARAAGDCSANVFTLSVSWRNDHRILDVANTIAEPLAAASTIPVLTLQARSDAARGRVDAHHYATLDDEAAGLAELIAEERSRAGTDQRVAILFRTRKNMSSFADALHERGIPAEIVGVGGVLDSPEVTDLVCALHVVHSADAGNELIRLLTGSRWCIGPRDIVELSRLARALAQRDSKLGRLDEGVDQTLRNSTAVDDQMTIVDALDFIGTADPELRLFAGFSPAGLPRLMQAARTFSSLRRAAGRPLLDLVRLTATELLLDIEVFANPTSPLPRRHLDAFEDKVREYVATAADATLGAFLGWLDHVRARENLAPEQSEPEPGTVQLLTVHAAKGLEWDVVAVPRFVAGEFPTAANIGLGWMSLGQLPNELRGDAADIPQLDWRAPSDAHELRDAIDDYLAAEAEQHALEERRIAYVALTRARRRLILTSSTWTPGNTQPREPSPYAAELDRIGIRSTDEEGTAASGKSESERVPRRLTWPLDPFGTAERRSAVEAAAAAVRAADPERAGEIADDIDVLLRERDELLGQASSVALPASVAASHLAEFISDPVQSALAVARPLPQRPSAAARLGTAFHSWVEQHYGSAGALSYLDAAALEVDDSDGSGSGQVDQVALERLTANFLTRSEWSGRRPVDIELAIQLPLLGRIIPCKLDAVFETDVGFEIVDWKTGASPRTEVDLSHKQLQLALYRLAYADWRSIDVDRVTAAFYYVAEDRVIRPESLPDRGQIEQLWRERVLNGG